MPFSKIWKSKSDHSYVDRLHPHILSLLFFPNYIFLQTAQSVYIYFYSKIQEVNNTGRNTFDKLTLCFKYMYMCVCKTSLP